MCSTERNKKSRCKAAFLCVNELASGQLIVLGFVALPLRVIFLAHEGLLSPASAVLFDHQTDFFAVGETRSWGDREGRRVFFDLGGLGGRVAARSRVATDAEG